MKICTLALLSLLAARTAAADNTNVHPHTGAPDPRTLQSRGGDRTGFNLANHYLQNGWPEHAAAQRRTSPHSYDPNGGAAIHNAQMRVAREAAATERAKNQAEIRSQGMAAQAIFANSDKPLAQTSATVRMSDGTSLQLNFTVTRDMKFTLTIPRWFDFGRGSRQGMRWQVPRSGGAVIRGTVSPQTGAITADNQRPGVNGHTYVHGRITPHGEVLLNQLDAVADNIHILRLAQNGQNLGRPRPVAPVVTQAATTEPAPQPAPRTFLQAFYDLPGKGKKALQAQATLPVTSAYGIEGVEVKLTISPDGEITAKLPPRFEVKPLLTYKQGGVKLKGKLRPDGNFKLTSKDGKLMIGGGLSRYDAKFTITKLGIGDRPGYTSIGLQRNESQRCYNSSALQRFARHPVPLRIMK